MTGVHRPTGGKSSSLGRRRDRLAKEQGWLCHWCRRRMYEAGRHLQLSVTADHVVPLSRGGPNELSNLVAACGQCNHHRAAQNDPVEYRPAWFAEKAHDAFYESARGAEPSPKLGPLASGLLAKLDDPEFRRAVDENGADHVPSALLDELSDLRAELAMEKATSAELRAQVKNLRLRAPVAHLEERRFSSSERAGSTLAGGAISSAEKGAA